MLRRPHDVRAGKVLDEVDFRQGVVSLLLPRCGEMLRRKWTPALSTLNSIHLGFREASCEKSLHFNLKGEIIQGSCTPPPTHTRTHARIFLQERSPFQSRPLPKAPSPRIALRTLSHCSPPSPSSHSVNWLHLCFCWFCFCFCIWACVCCIAPHTLSQRVITRHCLLLKASCNSIHIQRPEGWGEAFWARRYLQSVYHLLQLCQQYVIWEGGSLWFMWMWKDKTSLLVSL